MRMYIDMTVSESDLFLSNSRPVSPVTDGWWSYFGLEEKGGGGGEMRCLDGGEGRETLPLNMRELAA